jgi:hypothetical protein
MKTTVHTKADGFGNKMIITQDSSTAPWLFEVILYIHAEKKNKTIGRLDAKDRIIYLKREKAKHLHFISQSYGFNHMLLTEGLVFDTIQLTDDNGTYKFDKSVISENGTFIFFKQQGFERQLFVPIITIQKYSIHSLKTA